MFVPFPKDIIGLESAFWDHSINLNPQIEVHGSSTF